MKEVTSNHFRCQFFEFFAVFRNPSAGRTGFLLGGVLPVYSIARNFINKLSSLKDSRNFTNKLKIIQLIVQFTCCITIHLLVNSIG